MSVQIRRINCSDSDAPSLIADLRKNLSPDGNVVSERGRELTIKVFGQPLSAVEVVTRICNDVRTRGLAAVREYSNALDGFALSGDNLRVCPDELAAAHRDADPDFLESIRRIRNNIMRFQKEILHRDVVMKGEGQGELRLRYRPLKRVGVCVPGGAAAYPSTLLMTVCPAQAAGVQEIAVIAPPTRFGSNNPHIMAACHELGVDEVYRLGGAQGVAALAYGIDGLRAVDKIVGPGNLFVALAKQRVFGRVGIDMIAGPTEVVLIADETARADFIASDLISQAEHAPGASILITWNAELPEAVCEELERQLETLPRAHETRESLDQFGALVLIRDEDEAAQLANLIAPEHLHICTRNADELADRIRNAGATFIGSLTPVAVGDYVAGPSHVLPTGGTARFENGLSANDFLVRTSLIKYNREDLEKQAQDLKTLAEIEGLTGHSRSVEIRLNQS